MWNFVVLAAFRQAGEVAGEAAWDMSASVRRHVAGNLSTFAFKDQRGIGVTQELLGRIPKWKKERLIYFYID